MSDVGIRALKQNASQVVARVKAGEVVTITERGLPVAQLVPLADSPGERLIAAGDLRMPEADLEPLTSVLDEPAPDADRPSVSEALDELRAERG